MTRKLSRRQFLRTGFIAASSSAIALGFTGCSRLMTGSTITLTHRYGQLVPDPNGLLDLPPGFTYHAFSQTGETMSDGLLVPAAPDGMAAFPARNGKTILVRNHELDIAEDQRGAFGEKNEKLGRPHLDAMYDAGQKTKPPLGGTTTLVYDTKTQRLETHYLSLAGTVRNCAGGPTPWNTWISCEETVQRAKDTFERDHGYNFEVPAAETGGLVTPVPLKAMGRFNHEAVAVDARTGIVYQTEDRNNGLLYRFIPNRTGELAAGGRLQALKVRGMKSADTRNWRSLLDHLFTWGYDPIPVEQTLDVEWVDIENVESPKDDLRHQGFSKGAARFARGEGMWATGEEIFFVCTNGGVRKAGQIWRYKPSPFEGTATEDRHPGQLTLFIEPNDSDLMENADNLTVAPWGDLILCEDGPGKQFLVGITPQGQLYKLAQNALNKSEFAGSVFSPDGSTLFVNIMTPGITLAITGPWHHTQALSRLG